MNKNFAIIKSIFQDKIICEINDVEEKRSFLNLKDKNFYNFTGIYNYIITEDSNFDKLLYQVTSIYSKETNTTLGDDGLSKIKDTFMFEANPIGQWKNGYFKYGLESHPIILKGVRLPSNDEMSIIMIFKDEINISLGKLVGSENVTSKMSLDKFFNSHFLICGNTGSGKTTTLKFLINELLRSYENKRSLILFDTHNEYKDNDFNDLERVDISKDLKIKCEDIMVEDWCNLFYASSLTQKPILEQALKISSFYTEKFDCFICFKIWMFIYFMNECFNYSSVDTSIMKRMKVNGFIDNIKIELKSLKHNSKTCSYESKKTDEDIYLNELETFLKKYSHKFGSIDDIPRQDFISKNIAFMNTIFNDYDTLNLSHLIESEPTRMSDFNNFDFFLELSLLEEESHGNNQIRNNCMGLKTRVSNCLPKFKETFSNYGESNDDSFVDKYLQNKLTILFSSEFVSENEMNFLASIILNSIFEKNKSLNDKELRNLLTTNIIFDEAHRYIKEKNDSSEFTKTFDKIAREGRKFKLFMGFISQRPSELSKNTVSQCENFIAHKINNFEDVDFIKKYNPYIDKFYVQRLSLLTPGSCIITGNSVKFAFETHIKQNFE